MSDQNSENIKNKVTNFIKDSSEKAKNFIDESIEKGKGFVEEKKEKDIHGTNHETIEIKAPHRDK